MKKTLEWLKALPLFAVLLFVMNPEIRLFMLIADAIGLELLILLFATQFRLYFRYFLHFGIVPAYRYLCGFSRLPCFFPSAYALRQMPSLLLHAFPIGPLFATGSLIYIGHQLLPILMA